MITNKIEEIKTILELLDSKNTPSDKVLVCRKVLEKCIDVIYEYSKEKKPINATLVELISSKTVIDFIENDIIIDDLHFVRILGINAQHGKHIKKTQANIAINNTQFLIDLIEDKFANGKITKVDISKKRTISESDLSEYETRKIYIDFYLNEAGWEVVDPSQTETLPSGNVVKCGNVIPAKACSEIKVTGLPTASGIGFCDYVLYGKDGKPLAIVEAKKTSVDAIVGQQQVREYGRCMKEKYGYVPILYYTNGYDIFVIDGRYPERKVMSFHTIEELSLLLQQRSINKITDLKVNEELAGRPYQKMAITSICERFNDMQRKALIVMATGTGKTRTAIALVDILTRNNWAKNILFLADRTSLVKQAFRNFQKLLPNMTYCVLSDPSLANEPNARITFCTHQTMIGYIDSEEKELTIGRYDLIIIDEAHRSIFNKYGAIFSYFDSLLVGLTATPKDEVDANTYSLFNCESGIPNFSYSLEEAVKDHYLVPYKLVNRKTEVLSDGIKYSELSDEDKAQLAIFDEEDYDDDSVIKSNKIFKEIYNRDTCKKVLEDLMTNGIRVNQGQLIGKTIIFAINHKHAELIVKTFNDTYPMYPNYCKLIDNKVKKSEDLIDEFESDETFRIAVSVDMLDTGIDVPEVLNLVFFKRVNSNIKLIQMIGRGTRLCEGLIDGEDKKEFYIFDYFENFEERPDETVKQPITIDQKIFNIKLDLMCVLQTAGHQSHQEHKDFYEELKKENHSKVVYIKNSCSEKISVREKMDVVDKYYDIKEWEYISILSQKEIEHIITPLLESDLNEDYMSLAFDYIIYQIEKIMLETSSFKTATKLINKISLIIQSLLGSASIKEIYDCIEDLNYIYSGKLWENESISEIEHYRKAIRHLMKYITGDPKRTIYINKEDLILDGEGIINTSFDIRTYKEKVLDYLLENETNKTLMKIKNLEPLDSNDFNYLEKILWNDLGTKEDYYSISEVDNLAVFIRSIVGIDQNAVNKAFNEYLNSKNWTSEQQEFIYSIINYVRENGDVEPEVLINEQPFDFYNIAELFGADVPVLTNIINKLHECIIPAQA